MLGSRPMTKIKFMFMDLVENKPVNLYKDKKGRYWMACNKWGWFRVECKCHDENEIIGGGMIIFPQ